jgi:hypothetical protein
METSPADLNKLLKYALRGTNMSPRQMVPIPWPHLPSYISVELSVG